MKSLLLKNGTIVLPDREVVNAAVLIEDGKIASIGPHSENPGPETIDLSGATLLPGFIDVHIHGAVGVDVITPLVQTNGDAVLVDRGFVPEALRPLAAAPA